MIDRRPAIIVRRMGVADVIAAVQFARDEDLPIAVKGGGHNVAGNGTCDDGLLSTCPLEGRPRRPRSRTARAAGGARGASSTARPRPSGWRHRAAVSTTGIGGFTLGGGYGWLSPQVRPRLRQPDLRRRRHRRRQARHASETENPDLFWALRGGGGNFGVVTSFEYRLHPLGPIIYGGLMGFRMEQAPELIRFWRDFADAAPDELATAVSSLAAPPEEFVPQELHGKTVFGIIAAWAGDPAEGEAYLRR